MPFNAIPANDTALPIHIPMDDRPALSDQQLADWCADIGRTTADVLAIMFVLPAKPVILAMFEADMREEVGAAIDAAFHATDEERQHFGQIAWVAFDRRLALHTRALPYGGTA
jgi:hypothetical protein